MVDTDISNMAVQPASEIRIMFLLVYFFKSGAAKLGETRPVNSEPNVKRATAYKTAG